MDRVVPSNDRPPTLRLWGPPYERGFTMGQDTPKTPDDHVWYFAYDFNMASAIFVGNRGIGPLDRARVRLCGWMLDFDIPGMPYKGPLFASIRELNLSDRDCK